MRGREVEVRNGARSRRAGPVRFKTVPRQSERTSDRGRNPRKPKPVDRSTTVNNSQSRTRRRPNVRRIRTRDRIDMTERKRNALDDVAAFRVVSVRDLVEHRFGNNAFSARKGIDALIKDGLLEEHSLRVKSGKSFGVLTATSKGRKAAWGNRRHPQQRYWKGLVKTSALRHDTAVYQAARSEISKLEKSGATVKRIQLDYEMKSRVSKIAEKARAKQGSKAAHGAKLESARQMNLAVDEQGKVHYPDARIEYEDQEGGAGRVDVEVTSCNYRSKSLQAKLAAGFKLYANGSAAKRQLSSALGIKEPKSGSRGGGSNRDEELFEL